MLSIDVGKVSRHPAPAGPVGDDAIPQAAQQPPGLIPGILDAYPGCTPRPRNLPEYQAACRAAQGEAVVEYNACQVMPGMQAYQSGRFLTVTSTMSSPGGDVELTMVIADIVAIRVASRTVPVYVLVPAPDAATASGAGASVQEPTAAQR